MKKIVLSVVTMCLLAACGAEQPKETTETTTHPSADSVLIEKVDAKVNELGVVEIEALVQNNSYRECDLALLEGASYDENDVVLTTFYGSTNKIPAYGKAVVSLICTNPDGMKRYDVTVKKVSFE